MNILAKLIYQKKIIITSKSCILLKIASLWTLLEIWKTIKNQRKNPSKQSFVKQIMKNKAIKTEMYCLSLFVTVLAQRPKIILLTWPHSADHNPQILSCFRICCLSYNIFTTPELLYFRSVIKIPCRFYKKF